MTAWLAVALLGGVVALDTTSFPQLMVSRPLVAGAITGAVFGRPVDGIALGLVMEAFALVTLPIGAARYPESGTATVAAVAAYMAAFPPGIHAGPLLLAIAFALTWEWVAGETVVLQRRSNGRIIARQGGVAPFQLERRHLTAMSLDFLRGAAVASGGGLLGYGVLDLLGGAWGLTDDITRGILAVAAATMVGATLPLFGGGHARRVAWAAGVGAGLLLAVGVL